MLSSAGSIVANGAGNATYHHQHNQQATHHSLPNAYNNGSFHHHHHHHHHQYSMSGAVSSASSSSSSSSVSSNSSSHHANVHMNHHASQYQPHHQKQQVYMQTASAPVNAAAAAGSVQVSTQSLSTSQSTNKQTVLNHATIKLLKRLLDEASQTGDLNLANRNLNDFPSKLALNYDLSDTLTADLSKNHLTEFPKDLCVYDSLERLSLYSNLIRQVPDIQPDQLGCLKVLDLNSNNLSYLPSSICNLNSLQVLTVNNNKLVSLPEEIGRLRQLIQLDVSCNEITHLPVQIGDLSSLRALNIRHNLLVELPKEIAKLKLVNFDCSSNRLSKLPLCFRDMTTLIDLVVDHNPLELPPAHVCTKGLLHIMKYLLVEAIKEEKKRGVLTEYEINSQYNLSLNQQRSLSGGMTNAVNIGSFVFQSSMRNICKKAGNSSSSSSSSTSSVLSTSSLMSNPNTTSAKTCSKSTQQVSTIVATNELDLRVDYVDSSATRLTSSPSISSTSSSSSSSSSSSPPIVSNNNSNRCSIHEMLAIKSTTSTNSNMSQTLPHQHQLQQQQQQQQHQQKPNQLTYLRFDRTRKTSNTELQSVSNTSTQLTIGNDQSDSNKLVWRLPQSNTELKKTPAYQYPQQSHHHHLQTQQQYDANYANSNNNNSNNNSHHYSPMTSTCGLNSNNISSNTHLNANYQESNKRFNSTFNERASNMMFTNHGSNVSRNSVPEQCLIDSRKSSANRLSSDFLNMNLNEQQQQQQQPSHIIYEDDDEPQRVQMNQHMEVHETSSQTVSSCETRDNLDDVVPIDAPTTLAGEFDETRDREQELTTVTSATCSSISSSNVRELHNKEENYASSGSVPSETQVWVPREEFASQKLAQKVFVEQPLTLCNGRELPKDLKSINPAFTIRRHIVQVQEEQKQIETLKKIIEAKLKIQLPAVLQSTSCQDELSVALADGVILCHLMNQILPRAIQLIHVPTLAVPKLSLAKCRKNVENFIDACRRLGLAENDMCCAQDIIESKNIAKVARTVIMLVNHLTSGSSTNGSLVDHSGTSLIDSNLTTVGNVMNQVHHHQLPAHFHSYSTSHHFNSQQQQQATQTPQQQTAV